MFYARSGESCDPDSSHGRFFERAQDDRNPTGSFREKRLLKKTQVKKIRITKKRKNKSWVKYTRMCTVTRPLHYKSSMLGRF